MTPPILSPGRTRYALVPDRSAVVIEARSNVGPIAFGTTAIDGTVELSLDGGVVDTDVDPSARLDVDLATLRSGNTLYDAELLRRVDARRHPTTSVVLQSAQRIGGSTRYGVTGDLTFHGVTQPTSGTVAVDVGEDGSIGVVGEHLFDIRDFGLVVPSVLMLRIYPDVRIQLQLEARPEPRSPAHGGA